jgi:hypothetical protein
MGKQLKLEVVAGYRDTVPTGIFFVGALNGIKEKSCTLVC